MSEQDKGAPVVDEHEAFARDLVALCRKHGCGWITATFTLSGSRRFFEKTGNDTRVSVGWSEGRHGDRGQIQLRAEASVNITEDSSHD